MFNEESYVLETLSCLAGQSSSDFSVLVSDNASSDKSGEICADYCSQDPRFLYVRHKTNRGASFNFEYCFKSTDSQYFMWLGAHDTISSNYIKRTCSVLDRQGNISISSSRIVAVDETSTELGENQIAYYDFSENRRSRYLQSVRWLSDCTIVNSMFRREHLNTFGFKPVVGADHVLIGRLLWFGNVHYDKACTYYRRMFSIRSSTMMARVTGKVGTQPNYEDMIRFQLEDIGKLKDYGMPANFLIRYVIAKILRARFCGSYLSRPLSMFERILRLRRN